MQLPRLSSRWFARLVIAAVAGVFVMISLKFIFNPGLAAALSGVAPQSAVGITNTRAGFGGFPLGFAAILVFCLFSSRRLLPALLSIATVAATILIVRLYGAEQDGTLQQSAHVLIPEAAMFVLSAIGAWVESRAQARRRPVTARQPSQSHAP
jgi:hypothetical protein